MTRFRKEESLIPGTSQKSMHAENLELLNCNSDASNEEVSAPKLQRLKEPRVQLNSEIYLKLHEEPRIQQKYSSVEGLQKSRCFEGSSIP